MITIIIGAPLVGKTTLIKKLQEKNVRVFHADSFITKIYEKDGLGYKTIKEELGNDFVNNKAVDKKKLSAWILQDADNLKRLNELIHPLIKNHLEGKDNFIAELPIITTSPIKFKYDKIILVTTNPEVIVERFKKRNINPEFLQAIIDGWTNDFKFDFKVDTTNGISDDVIDSIIDKFIK
ncbi:MAG: dephospho-CoA kinase [Mycoplasmataceae bacterium]|nr:dephospho-CoA kinase [Mycoplasmataceae bacterium]